MKGRNTYVLPMCLADLRQWSPRKGGREGTYKSGPFSDSTWAAFDPLLIPDGVGITTSVGGLTNYTTRVKSKRI